MKEFCGTFTVHLKRGIISPIFVFCTTLCMLFMAMYIAEGYNLCTTNPTAYGLYYFLDLVDHKGSRYFLMMIAAFPGALMFYDDWKSGNFKFIISRAGRGKYAFAVTLAAGITASAVMCVSYILFSAFLLTKFPIVPEIEPEKLRSLTFGFPNSGLIHIGHAILCYILYFLMKGTMAAFFAIVAVFQSIIITNKPLTIISPVLIYIIYFSFNFFYITPTLLNPFVIYWNGYKLYLVFGGTEDGSLFSPFAAVYPIMFTVAVAIISPLIETKILRIKMNRSI